MLQFKQVLLMAIISSWCCGTATLKSQGSSHRPLALLIKVSISNEVETAVLWMSPLSTNADLYHNAATMEIISDIDAVFLCVSDTKSPQIIADDVNVRLSTILHPDSPRHLHLDVVPIPAMVLLFGMLKDMTPNLEILWWNEEILDFCIRNLRNSSCHNVSQWIFEGISLNECNLISIEIGVETWTGHLNLQYVPRNVDELFLFGQSVAVDLLDLHYSVLRKLDLDFEEISGIDLMALEGLELQRLYLSVNASFANEPLETVLEKMSERRVRGELNIDIVEFDDLAIEWDSVQKEYIRTVLGGPSSTPTGNLEHKQSIGILLQ